MPRDWRIQLDRLASPVRKSLEKALRPLKTDYIDVFHYLGVMNPRQFGPRVRDELAELRRDGE